MHYDDIRESHYNQMPPPIISEKERCRGAIYSQAGDDRSILGRTNDMTAWLYLSLTKLLQAIQNEEITNIQTTAKSILDECSDTASFESTVDLKGADAVISRFVENNNDIEAVLKEQYKLKEQANNG